ncbi:MAG: HNH endonuclease [Neisseriaceae bacterium]|nr:MAG: HNH endonuclease [Neisseriaceae bacterium]
MSKEKKSIRATFRKKVFERDKYKCRCCGIKGKDRNESCEEILEDLDAHHIKNRSQMPNGGYVKENGISLCNNCHEKAEQFWKTGIAFEGYSPEDLYRLIGSSEEKAIKKSLDLQT